ncbi:hypothetical protein GH714_029628 [Hevea brasiliensis]|uniref:EF-hand domain-containing protein n=1 Tax=Hevea brasiliensis TaxID=3981 RepID=A0A6A6NJX6_HEVBR|nr:hypothetical protein GH714_029628 [Hevea brasiliensis]
MTLWELHFCDVSSRIGSIGPFFGVISVLAVLAILSCILGRICSRRAVAPPNTFNHKGCLGWVKRRIRRSKWCRGGDVEMGVNKEHNSLNINMAATAAIRVEQFNQLKEIFARFDMDSDGSLTILELAALLRSLGLKPSGDQIHVLLANMDSNGNGFIEFDELVNAILPDMNEEIFINQDQLLDVFQLFDRDGNGYISAAELAGSMAKMGQPLTYTELMEMIEEADADGDGVISFNEFTSVMAKSAMEFLGLALS